jgi:hypothetical protein
MFDIGVTWSRKPQFGLYGNCPFMAPSGYAKVHGKYAGIGGGQVGVMEHRQDNLGLLLWGREKVAWGDSRPDDPGTMQAQEVAPGGLATDPEGKPTYRPTCAHYLHLGYVGLTGNANYREWADFLLGWFGLDISRDDNRSLGAGKVRAGNPPTCCSAGGPCTSPTTTTAYVEPGS